MTVEIALFLLSICAAFTGMITEALKKMFNISKPTIVAAIVAIIVGVAVPGGYMIINHMPFTPQDIVYLIGMVVLTWLSATIGYDKVREIIEQLFPAK